VTVAVKLYGSSVKGAGHKLPFMANDKNSILFVCHLEIDGISCFTEGEVRFSMDGSEGFFMLELHRPTPERQLWMDTGFSRSPKRKYGYENIRAFFTDPDDYMEGTDDDVLILGVHKLEFIEWIVPKYEMPTSVFPIPA